MTGFTCISNDVIDAIAKLKVIPFALYVTLKRHDNKTQGCFPGQDVLAKELGLKDRTTVTRAMNALVDAGLVERIRRGNGRSNLYRFPADVAVEQQLRGSDVALEQQLKGADVALQLHQTSSGKADVALELQPDVALQLQPIREQDEVEQKRAPFLNGHSPDESPSSWATLHNPSPLPPSPEFTSDFKKFMADYPAGRVGNKQGAFACWLQMSPDERQQAMTALPVWKESDQWIEGSRWVPYSDKYLNRRDWETPPVVAKKKVHRGIL